MAATASSGVVVVVTATVVVEVVVVVVAADTVGWSIGRSSIQRQVAAITITIATKAIKPRRSERRSRTGSERVRRTRGGRGHGPQSAAGDAERPITPASASAPI